MKVAKYTVNTETKEIKNTCSLGYPHEVNASSIRAFIHRLGSIDFLAFSFVFSFYS